MTCALFGHHDMEERIKPILRETIIDLIENRGVDMFYVGNHGRFDSYAYRILSEMEGLYSHIDFCVVLAYVPSVHQDLPPARHTLYPEGLERAPYKFAITYRNRWMINHADCVVAHMRRCWGGVADAVKYARGKKKEIVSI